MSVTINEILAADSISGSRLTTNSNFLLLENAYNDLEDTFNINVITGSMDVSTATSGQIKAKSLLANSLLLPASGTPSIALYGTGANAGNISATGSISGATGLFSGSLSVNAFSASGTAVFAATGTFNGPINQEGRLTIGPSGSVANTNRKATVGATAAFSGTLPDNGVTGTYDDPYQLDLSENVIYINSAYNSGATAGFDVGFYFYATTGSGATASDIPDGYTITLIDAATGAGKIVTGVTGAAPYYYTGFNETVYSSGEFATPGNSFLSSLTLMWESRLAKSSPSQKGSWVVVSSTPGYSF